MQVIAGIDEVGRGCLAGPVVVAAVILPDTFDDEYIPYIAQIKDSKKLSEKKRNVLDEVIKCVALDYSIAFIDNNTIDIRNIRNATLLGMQSAYKGLNITPDILFVDGDFYTPVNGEKYECIPQGDSKVLAISAASILAKVARDTYCKNVMHVQYPVYKWDKNKAYGTKEHYESIKNNGITPFHRKSFDLHV